MIDEQKIIGMLQAKALNCLDPEDELLLNSFINEGHIFPWDKLGSYQNIVSLLPLSLDVESPDAELKDKVALRLIKLRDEQLAKKALEEEKARLEAEIAEQARLEVLRLEEEARLEAERLEEQARLETQRLEEEARFEAERLEEEARREAAALKEIEKLNQAEHDKVIDDYQELDEQPLEERGNFTAISGIENDKFSEEENFRADLEESAFNLDDVVLPGYNSEPNIDAEETNELNNVEPDLSDKINSADFNLSEQQLADQTTELVSFTEPIEAQKTSDRTSPVDEKSNLDTIVPKVSDIGTEIDFTKKSVVEKMYKALEQDFDALKFRYEESERRLKRGILLAYIIIGLLIGLLVFTFAKFNSEIEELKNPIKQSSSIIQPYRIKTDFNFLS